MPPFTKIQPKEGDVVLHCVHFHERNQHWWKAALKFQRPDGTKGEAEWITACQECAEAAGGDPMKIAITGDGVWQGDDPAIKVSQPPPGQN